MTVADLAFIVLVLLPALRRVKHETVVRNIGHIDCNTNTLHLNCVRLTRWT